VNSLIFYYFSVFSGERNIPHFQCANSGEPLTTVIKVIGRKISSDLKKEINIASQYYWRNC
jgi:hypothetical protein